MASRRAASRMWRWRSAGCAASAIALFVSASLLWSQASELAVLNRRILEIEARWRAAVGAERDALAGEVDALLARREGSLSSLIQENAGEAASLAFPAHRVASLRHAFPESAQQLEQWDSWEGVLEELVEDDLDRGVSRTLLRLKTAGETLEVFWVGPRPGGAQAGAVVRLRGVRSGHRIATTSATVVALATHAPACSTAGQQNVAAILIETPSYKLPAAVDADQVRGILFGNQFTGKDTSPDRLVDDFWRENSDGQTYAPGGSGAVVGPFLLSKEYDRSAAG